MPNCLKEFGSTKRDGAAVRFAAIFALAVSLALNSSPLAATDDDDGAAPETQPASTDGAETIVQSMIDEWLQKGPGRAIRERDNLNVVQGTSLVPVKADNRRWSKARSLTFQNAFVQAMGDYMASVRQRTSVSVIRNFFEDDIPESELRYQEGEAADSYVERIVLKRAALAEHTLDRKLAESGMDQDEIQRLTTPVQKRTALAESIKRTTLNEAMGSAAGLIPVKTFEGVDDEGNTAIGVVAVYSERMRHIANQVAKGEVIRPDPARSRSPIADQIADFDKNAELPNEFGVRVMWDEQGYPAIVSFGQWGWSPANLSKKKRDRRRKSAMKKAAIDAKSNLAVFVSASTRFSQEGSASADLEEAFNLPRGGVPEETEEVEIADKVIETARINAEVTLTGSTVERRWAARHPLLDDQELVGAVVYWSPAREDAIRKTVGMKAKHAPPKEEPSRKPQQTHISGSAESREPDLADF